MAWRLAQCNLGRQGRPRHLSSGRLGAVRGDRERTLSDHLAPTIGWTAGRRGWYA